MRRLTVLRFLGASSSIELSAAESGGSWSCSATNFCSTRRCCNVSSSTDFIVLYTAAGRRELKARPKGPIGNLTASCACFAFEFDCESVEAHVSRSCHSLARLLFGRARNTRHDVIGRKSAGRAKREKMNLAGRHEEGDACRRHASARVVRGQKGLQRSALSCVCSFETAL